MKSFAAKGCVAVALFGTTSEGFLSRNKSKSKRGGVAKGLRDWLNIAHKDAADENAQLKKIDEDMVFDDADALQVDFDKSNNDLTTSGILRQFINEENGAGTRPNTPVSPRLASDDAELNKLHAALMDEEDDEEFYKKLAARISDEDEQFYKNLAANSTPEQLAEFYGNSNNRVVMEAADESDSASTTSSDEDLSNNPGYLADMFDSVSSLGVGMYAEEQNDVDMEQILPVLQAVFQNEDVEVDEMLPALKNHIENVLPALKALFEESEWENVLDRAMDDDDDHDEDYSLHSEPEDDNNDNNVEGNLMEMMMEYADKGSRLHKIDEKLMSQFMEKKVPQPMRDNNAMIVKSMDDDDLMDGVLAALTKIYSSEIDGRKGMTMEEKKQELLEMERNYGNDAWEYELLWDMQNGPQFFNARDTVASVVFKKWRKNDLLRSEFVKRNSVWAYIHQNMEQGYWW